MILHFMFLNVKLYYILKYIFNIFVKVYKPFKDNLNYEQWLSVNDRLWFIFIFLSILTFYKYL